MPIKFACPSCGKGYNVKDSLAGKKAKCKCGAVMPVPAAAAAAPSAPVENDPLFGDDPLGGDLFGDASSPGTGASGTGASGTDSLFDEEFPAGETLPAAPVAYQAAALPTSPQQASLEPASPVPSAGGYAVAVPTVGPITESSESESSSMGGGSAFLIGVGLSGAGAMLGALVWALIAIFTGYEIGWIAWGVGFCAGFGMAIAHNLSDAIDDFLGGVIASTMAILGVLAGKYAVY